MGIRIDKVCYAPDWGSKLPRIIERILRGCSRNFSCRAGCCRHHIRPAVETAANTGKADLRRLDASLRRQTSRL